MWRSAEITSLCQTCLTSRPHRYFRSLVWRWANVGLLSQQYYWRWLTSSWAPCCPLHPEQLGLSYKGWANVEFTGRNDWDSRLLQQNRSFFYPAANASLVLSDLVDALKNSNNISFVKLRGAVSKSGNVNLAPYSLSATYSQPGGFPYGSMPVSRRIRLVYGKQHDPQCHLKT